MSEITKMGFGAINDNDPELAAKASNAGGEFGLNQGFFTKLSYEPNGGAKGAPGDCFDINVKVGEREFRTRIFDVTRVYGNNGELTDVNSEEYKKKYNETLNQNLAVITHAVKATGVTQEQINAVFTNPVNSFADWCKVMTSLIPQNYLSKPVHIFLEYQWEIPEGKDKTYLTLPKNMKGGRFLAPLQPGKWTEQRTWNVTNEAGQIVEVVGLRYVNESQNVHPFIKTQDFMESNKGQQQIAGQQTNALSQQQTAAGATW